MPTLESLIALLRSRTGGVEQRAEPLGPAGDRRRRPLVVDRRTEHLELERTGVARGEDLLDQRGEREVTVAGPAIDDAGTPAARARATEALSALLVDVGE
jgi:hypothetical protein